MNSTSSRAADPDRAGRREPPADEVPHCDPLSEDADLRDQLSQSLKCLKESIAPLWHALVGLFIAQARLTKVLFKERARVTVARAIILLHIWVAAGAAWVFLNIAAWRVSMEIDEGGILAPFAILILHAIAILAMVSYYKRLKL